MSEYTWEDPEIHQVWAANQSNQNDWLNETQKKCPIKVILQTTVRVRLSDSLPEFTRVSMHMYCILFPLQFSSVQSLSHVQLFATPWTAAF